jgi:hypothetical protein
MFWIFVQVFCGRVGSFVTSPGIIFRVCCFSCSQICVPRAFCLPLKVHVQPGRFSFCARAGLIFAVVTEGPVCSSDSRLGFFSSAQSLCWLRASASFFTGRIFSLGLRFSVSLTDPRCKLSVSRSALLLVAPWFSVESRAGSVPSQGLIFLAHGHSFILVSCVDCCRNLSCVFKLPDQKDRDFLVLTAFKRLFFEHVYKMFGEMLVRI